MICLVVILLATTPGKYEHTGAEEEGRGVWRHSTILTTMHLHYTVDEHYKWEGWMITQLHNQTFGYIRSGRKVIVVV